MSDLKVRPPEEKSECLGFARDDNGCWRNNARSRPRSATRKELCAQPSAWGMIRSQFRGPSFNLFVRPLFLAQSCFDLGRS